MINRSIHFIYLAIIIPLAFQNWRQHTTLKTTAASLATYDAAMQSNTRVVFEAANKVFLEIQKNVNAYPNTLQKSFLEKAQIANELARKYVIGLSEEKEELGLTAGFSSHKTKSLKDSLAQFHQSLLNLIDNKQDLKAVENSSSIAKLLKNDTLWHNLSNRTLQDAFLQLSVFQNAIEYDKLGLFNYIYLQVAGCITIRLDKFMVSVAPKKSVLIEGETFEGQLFATPYFSGYHDDIDFFANGQKIPFKNWEAHVNLPNQTVGTKKLQLEARLRNPLTGQFESAFQEFEYEVLPKCSRDCR